MLLQSHGFSEFLTWASSFKPMSSQLHSQVESFFSVTRHWQWHPNVLCRQRLPFSLEFFAAVDTDYEKTQIPPEATVESMVVVTPTPADRFAMLSKPTIRHVEGNVGPRDV